MKTAVPASPTLPDTQATKTPARQDKLKSSAASATPFKPLSTPKRPSNARPVDLPTKISQLKTTIEHTQQQFTDTLNKIAALPSSGSQQPSTSNTTATLSNATTFTAISTTPDLTPDQQAALARAQGVLDGHIKLLGQYNELKDAGMMMMGLIAEREARVVRDVMEERGVGEED